MQFSAIRTYCATRFRDTTNVIVSDADWKNYVNSAYGDALGSVPFFPWNELSATLTIVAGVRGIPLPLDAWEVTAVYDQTNGFPMVPLEGRDQVFHIYPTQTEVGMAVHYRIFDNQLEVYPLPQSDTVYLVEYQKMPGDMVADSDLPVFPDQFHDMLTAGAVAMAYKDDGNTSMAQQFQGEFDSSLKDLKVWAMQPRQSRYYEPIDTMLSY